MVYSQEYDTIVDGPPCLIFPSDNESNTSSAKLAKPKMNVAKSSSLAPPSSSAKQRKPEKTAMGTPAVTFAGIHKKNVKSSATPVATTNAKTNSQMKKFGLQPPTHEKHSRTPKLEKQSHNTVHYHNNNNNNTLAVPRSPYINEKQQLHAVNLQQQQPQLPRYTTPNVAVPVSQLQPQPPQQSEAIQAEVPMAFKVAGGAWDYLKQIFKPPLVTTVRPDIGTIQNTAIPGQFSPTGQQFQQNRPPPYFQQAPQRSPAPAHLNVIHNQQATGVPLGAPLIAPQAGFSQIPPQQTLGQFQQWIPSNPNNAGPRPLGLVPGAAFGTPLMSPITGVGVNNHVPPSSGPPHASLKYPDFFPKEDSVNYDQMYLKIIEEDNKVKSGKSNHSLSHRQTPIDLIRSASTPLFVLIASVIALAMTSSTVPSTNFFQQIAGYINSLVRTCAAVGGLISAIFLGIKFMTASPATNRGKASNFEMKFVAGQSLGDEYGQNHYNNERISPFVSPHFFPAYVPPQQNQIFYPNPPPLSFIPPSYISPMISPNMISVTPQVMPTQIPMSSSIVTPQLHVQPPTIPNSQNTKLSGSTLQVPLQTPSTILPGTPISRTASGQLSPGMLKPELLSSAKSNKENPPPLNKYLSNIGVSSATETPLNEGATKTSLNTPAQNISERVATPALPQLAQTPSPIFPFAQTPTSVLTNASIAMPNNVLKTPLQIPDPHKMGTPLPATVPAPVPAPVPIMLPASQPALDPEANVQASNKGFVKHISFVPAGTILDDMKYLPDEKIDPAKLRYFDLADDKLRNDLKEELLLRSNHGHILMPPLPNVDDPGLEHLELLKGSYATFPLNMETLKENLSDRGLMGEKLPPINYKQMYEVFEKRLDAVSMRPANASKDKDGTKTFAEKKEEQIKSILKTPSKIKSATLPGDAILDDYYVDDYACKPYGPPPKRYRALRV
ncbi:uncharacterized protein SAPINGB_P001859 [Magnusiomyces paraingens]|uniref:Uncharacterized protein n=1 Tax=Magnusiomyces paraingens TaxID=2606893 RepID=A0A5E8BBK6_9ASCO|nr:uncharacterized protein SAPINGB_P001859 [Saprochaete ingens]VVT48601.1 unnamed protein product [Saprochaete ingens]